MRHRKFHLSDGLMLVAVLIWAANYSVLKIALKEIPPLPLNGIRLLLSSAVLVIWFLITERNFKVQKEHILKIVFLSISGYTIYQYIFIRGIDLTNASNTAVIFGVGPIMISLFSVVAKHETIKPIAWVGILMGFLGVYITIMGKAGGLSLSSKSLQGDLLIFGAVLLWAHYSVSARPLLKTYSPLKFTMLTMTIGSLLFFPVTIGALRTLPYAAISFKAWFCMAFSGVMALSVGLIIWFYSVQKIGNSQTAVYSNLPPALAMVFAWLLLSERISPSLMIGAAIIFLGIYFTRKGREIT
ncbi:MAG: DMT family transporter [Candidatus Aminicenantes bacterium]|nr:DMT family transporter [Candidatus Aminicenantes bacterium]